MQKVFSFAGIPCAEAFVHIATDPSTTPSSANTTPVKHQDCHFFQEDTTPGFILLNIPLIQAGCFAFLKSFSCFSNSRKKKYLISNLILVPPGYMVASACLNGTYSLGPDTGRCLMSGDSQQCGANHTGEELLKNPSRRAHHRDRQQRSLSSTGKHLAALSLESGEMKAPRCTSRQLQGALEPILTLCAMFPE